MLSPTARPALTQCAPVLTSLAPRRALGRRRASASQNRGVAAGAGAGLAVAFIPQLTARRKELRQRRERCTLLARGGEADSVHSGFNSAVGGRLRVKQILEAADGGKSMIGQKVTVCGWVRTVRAQKSLAFLKINDGSTVQELQVVVLADAKGFEDVKAQGTGASVRVEGQVVESPAKGQVVEISCSSAEHSVQVLGTVESKEYPLAKKKHTIEYMREIAHLRPRSNLIGAVSRVRNTLAMSTHQFFQDRGFLYVHTPIITTADCEGAGEMFRISQEKGESEKKDQNEEFFGRPAYLTVSGQLQVENFCCGLGDVYTFGPTFRAENSSTTRHLAEFWMIEPEMAFANLEDDMDCAEAYIRYCVSQVLEKCKSDVDFFNLRVDKEIKERLELIASKDFARMSYTEAVEVLQKHIEQGDVKFEFEVAWGKELQTEHEKFLTDHVCKGPLIVYNYPKECKAFYMRLNEDGKTVAAMDLLCPGIGELVGGSQREERIEVLDERIEGLGLPKEDYWWYRDLRVLYAVAEAAWFLLMSRIICGIGASVTPLLFAWTARALTGVDEVAQAQVRLNTLRSLGTTIGPFSSTILAVLPQEGLFNELNSAGWAIAIVNLFGLLLVWRFLDDIPPVPKVTTNDIEQNKAKDTAVWTNPVLWICLLFQVVTALLLAILEVIPPIVLTTQFGMPPSATSVLFGIVSLVILAVFAVTAAIGSRISRRSLMCLGVGSIFAGGLWAEFGWTTGAKLWEFIVPWVILATAPAPLIRTPARAVYTSHLPISIQGVMQGISESAFSLANFLGPILGSYVAEEGGLPGLRFLMLLLVSVECSLLIVGFTRLVPGEELQ